MDAYEFTVLLFFLNTRLLFSGFSALGSADRTSLTILLTARNNKSVRLSGRGRTVLDRDLAAQ